MTRHSLQASGVFVSGRPRPMLTATDVELHSGEVRAVVGEPGHSHTALALILAGRLRPDAGRVVMDGSSLDRTRQLGVALVDVPGVSEPDEVVSFTTILGEELSMAGQTAGGRAVREWAGGVDVGRRTEDIPVPDRIAMLLRATALRPTVRFLVLTLPDRWGATPETWQPPAAELAARGFGVLVTVGETSRHLLDVPHTMIGGA